MERSRVAGEAPTGTRILLASLSAMVAETVTFLIDLTKTRMQLHGSGSASTAAGAHRIGAIRVASGIVRPEGVNSLYKGLTPVIIRHLFYTPIRIIGYENLKGFIFRSDANNGESPPFATKALVGGISGVIAQGEKEAVYRNSYECLVKMVRFEGIRALWKGFFPTWARLGPWQFVFWVSYEKFRQLAGISSF